MYGTITVALSLIKLIAVIQTVCKSTEMFLRMRFSVVGGEQIQRRLTAFWHA